MVKTDERFCDTPELDLVTLFKDPSLQLVAREMIKVGRTRDLLTANQLVQAISQLCMHNQIESTCQVDEALVMCTLTAFACNRYRHSCCISGVKMRA